MATYRVHRTKDFTVMSNYHLRDKNLSLKAKGLLSVFLSLPDDWDYSVDGIIAICKEGRFAVEGVLKELKEAGYLTVSRNADSGKFDYDYEIFETSQASPYPGFPSTGNPSTGNPSTGNPSTGNHPTESNTNKSNTNKSNTDKSNTDGKRGRFQPPSVEEARAYCEERRNSVDAERFVSYYESNGWMVGKNKMKDWKAAVRTWERSKYGAQNRDNFTYCRKDREDELPY